MAMITEISPNYYRLDLGDGQTLHAPAMAILKRYAAKQGDPVKDVTRIPAKHKTPTAWNPASDRW